MCSPRLGPNIKFHAKKAEQVILFLKHSPYLCTYSCHPWALQMQHAAKYTGWAHSWCWLWFPVTHDMTFLPTVKQTTIRWCQCGDSQNIMQFAELTLFVQAVLPSMSCCGSAWGQVHRLGAFMVVASSHPWHDINPNSRHSLSTRADLVCAGISATYKLFRRSMHTSNHSSA